MTPKQKAWAIQAEHVIKQMERRHFNAYYCSTKEEALSKALSIIEKGSVIASGGSATIEEADIQSPQTPVLLHGVGSPRRTQFGGQAS